MIYGKHSFRAEIEAVVLTPDELKKSSADIECTPSEARQFLGLPNVEPIQNAAMAHIEKRILNEMERFSPEALLKSGFALSPINQEQMKQFFTNVFKNVPPRG